MIVAPARRATIRRDTNVAAKLTSRALARRPVSDAELVQRSRAGDIAAFEALVDRHRAVVDRVAARIVGSDDAADVTQDAFLRAFHRLRQFRGDSAFRTWLLRIAHNAALDTLARQRADPVDPDEVERLRNDAASLRPRAPADALEVTERRARLSLKLREVRPEHRVVLVLRDLEGMPYEEIASITGTPLGSVKGRLHRARRELIEILRRNTYDWELPDG
jgi:RNA polymerase sigma-70 factor, ECF subfamily